jgi:hypothetical protein
LLRCRVSLFVLSRATANAHHADHTCLLFALLQDPEKVAQLGEEMQKLFELHNSVASIAMEGSKAPSKKGSKRGAATAAAAGGTAPDAGGEQQVG